MDSLLAAKLRTKLKQDLNLLVSVGELLGERPLTELASQLHARVNGGRPSEVLAS
jgi:hypothetical protein